MKTKRVYYPVNKAQIEKCIKLYLEFHTSPYETQEHLDAWNKFYDNMGSIADGSASVAMPSLFQAMAFSDTLTVDNVYNAIIASGINTRLEEVYE